MIKITEELFI